MPMKIEKVYPGQVIQLGRRGENLARQVEFDLTDWKKQYGEGIPELLFQRFGDARPFIRDLEVVENRAIWTLTSWDTDIAKPGKVELRWYCGELLAKSQSWSTSVENALDTPGIEPAVNPEKSWFDEVLIAATGVGAHAEAAKASADDAAASAQEAAEQLANIGESAQRAEEARAKSEEISKKVTGELSVAGVYANNAKVYAEGGSLQELIEQPNGDIWIGMTTMYTRGAEQYADDSKIYAQGGYHSMGGAAPMYFVGSRDYAAEAKAYAESGSYKSVDFRGDPQTLTVAKGAQQYAEDAKFSVSEAKGYMTSAQTAATEAYDNRVATNTFKEQARSASQSASTFASNASKAETSARSYANAAQSSMQKIEISLAEAQREANKAMVARDEAVAAKTAAEQAREDAQWGADQAMDARDMAVKAQTAAEKARDEAQAAAGGGGTTAVKEIEVVESWVSTSAEVEAAYQSGKMVMLVDAGMPFHLVFRRSATEHWFANVDSEYYCTYCVINDEWEFHESMYAPRSHADNHKATGWDPITPEDIGAVTKEYVDNAVANAGAGLPEHTSADNGKFLRIVDGAPAWATVQNAEGVSF